MCHRIKIINGNMDTTMGHLNKTTTAGTKTATAGFTTLPFLYHQVGGDKNKCVPPSHMTHEVKPDNTAVQRGVA